MYGKYCLQLFQNCSQTGISKEVIRKTRTIKSWIIKKKKIKNTNFVCPTCDTHILYNYWGKNMSSFQLELIDFATSLQIKNNTISVKQ